VKVLGSLDEKDSHSTEEYFHHLVTHQIFIRAWAFLRSAIFGSIMIDFDYYERGIPDARS
jgi:hypothetical protein